MSKIFKNTLKNFTKLSFSSSISSLLNLLCIFLINIILDKSDFGFFILTITYLEILDSFFNIKCWKAFIKFSVDLKHKSKNISYLFYNSIVIDFFFVIVTFSISLICFDFYSKFYTFPENIEDTLRLLLLSLLFKTFDVYLGLIRLYNNFIHQVRIELSQSLLYATGIIFIYFLNGTLSNIVYIYLFCQCFGMFFKLYSIYLNAKKEQFISFKEYLKNKEFKTIEFSFIKFISYNNFTDSIRVISRRIDFVIIGHLVNPSAVGIYKLVISISDILARLANPLYQVMFPEIAKLVAKKQFDQLSLYIKKITRTLTVFCLVYLTVFFVFGESVLDLFIGNDSNEVFYFASFQSLIIAGSIIIFYMPLLMDSFGKVKEAFLNQFYASAIYLAILYFLIERFEIMGAIISYFIYYLVWTILTFYSLPKFTFINEKAN